MRKKFSDCVRPGVDDVRARPRTPSRELIKLDFPTFERPRKAISGLQSPGQSVSSNALLMNSALVTFIVLAAASCRYAQLRQRVEPQRGARAHQQIRPLRLA